MFSSFPSDGLKFSRGVFKSRVSLLRVQAAAGSLKCRKINFNLNSLCGWVLCHGEASSRLEWQNHPYGPYHGTNWDFTLNFSSSAWMLLPSDPMNSPACREEWVRTADTKNLGEETYQRCCSGHSVGCPRAVAFECFQVAFPAEDSIVPERSTQCSPPVATTGQGSSPVWRRGLHVL